MVRVNALLTYGCIEGATGPAVPVPPSALVSPEPSPGGDGDGRTSAAGPQHHRRRPHSAGSAARMVSRDCSRPRGERSIVSATASPCGRPPSSSSSRSRSHTPASLPPGPRRGSRGASLGEPGCGLPDSEGWCRKTAVSYAPRGPHWPADCCSRCSSARFVLPNLPVAGEQAQHPRCVPRSLRAGRACSP